MSAGTGSQRSSIDELKIVNLNVWSENLPKVALKSAGTKINATEPNTRKKGRISNPIRIPNRDRTGPVTKNCMMIEHAPATE